MELTKLQQEGLELAVERYNEGQPYTVISGFAGSGKSTLIKFIIAALGLSDEEVAYVAFTGKAAEVLRHKGCPNACTAHKLLYYATKKADGKFIFKPRVGFENPYKLIIVDEVSMLPIQMWNLLLSHRVPVIACGDPGQIPPIDKNSDNGVLNNPHIFLDEIMRQAQDSEIIKLSMDIRENKPISYTSGNEVKVVPKDKVVTGMYTWADQIITATNPTRRRINDETRAALGRTGGPQVGDKVISLENHWDILDDNEESALTNGTIGYIKEIEETSITYRISPTFIIGPVAVYKMTIENEMGEIFRDIIIDKKYFLTGVKSLSSKQEYRIYNCKKVPSTPCLFEYGYTVTGHKAQGSSWDKVLVIEEGFPYEKDDHRKWVYTAVTRAESKCVLVR